MKIKLKVLKGQNAGREVKVPMPKCIIGRGEGCHMRPKSEAISRRHCVIFVKEGTVYIRDLKSRNGTIVNGKPIEADQVLKSEDTIQVGPLSFEILIDRSLGGQKKPKITSIKEAAVRTKATASETIDLESTNISDWLDEADEEDRARRLTDPETRQLKLDETDRVDLQKAIESRAKAAGVEKVEADADAAIEAEQAEEAEKKKKKEPGKLPQLPDQGSKDSREAATDMLKKFFNNR